MDCTTLTIQTYSRKNCLRIPGRNHYFCRKHQYNNICCACYHAACQPDCTNELLKLHQKIVEDACTPIFVFRSREPLGRECSSTSLLHVRCNKHANSNTCCSCRVLHLNTKCDDRVEVKKCPGCYWTNKHSSCARGVCDICCECAEFQNWKCQMDKPGKAQAPCSTLSRKVERRNHCEFVEEHYMCEVHKALPLSPCCSCKQVQPEFRKVISVEQRREEAQQRFSQLFMNHMPPPYKKEDGYELCRVQEQGQVNSASTGNKTNVATGGSTIYNISYYGNDYTQAYNPTQQQMDPGKFIEPVAGMIAGATPLPQLMHPTAEACGQSDRVLQLTAGNSTLITQESAGGAVIGYGQLPEYDEGANCGVDMMTRPGVSCDRWYTLTSIAWTASGLECKQAPNGVDGVRDIVSIPFPAALDKGVFGENLAYHYAYKCGYGVHVMVNASKFHCGLLGVYMIPEMRIPDIDPDGKTVYETLGYNFQNLAKSLPKEQLTLFPHQFINLRTNNSATIVVPYVGSTPMDFYWAHSNWVLLLVSHIDLNYAAGAPTNVSITVSVCPLKSQFSGLRGAIKQGVPTFLVPGSGQFSNILRNPGYPAYPTFESTHGFENPGRFRNLLEAAMVPSMLSNSFPVTNQKLSMERQNPSVPEKLFELDLSLADNRYINTYLGNLCRMFNQYRGSLNFTFMYCGTAMHTGKILIAYTPPGISAPQNREEAMLGTHVVWDFGLQSSVTMTVPYISISQYRFALDENTLGYDGWITAWYQTTVVGPPNTPNTTQIVCFVGAADDFVLRQPYDSNYFQGPNEVVPVTPGQPMQNHQQPDRFGQALLDLMVQTLTNRAPGAVQSNSTNNLPVEGGESTHMDYGSSALNAPESGVFNASASATAIALRKSEVTFSRDETDLEIFLSRYNLLHEASINGDSVELVDFTVDKWAETNPLLKTKLNMFTYFRCSFDFVVVACPNVTSTTQDFKYQVVFVPQSIGKPGQDSKYWNGGINPVFTANIKDYVSFRIPFLSPSNYYSTRYCGFSSFDRRNARDFPGNHVGRILVRLLRAGGSQSFGVGTKIGIQIWVRPVGIEAHCPRPIVSYKPSVNYRMNGPRVFFLQDDDPSGHKCILRDDTDIKEQGLRVLTDEEMIDPQGPIDKIKTKVDGALKQAGSRFGDGVIDSLSSKFKEIIPKQTMPRFVIKAIKWLFKICVAVYVACKCDDPVIIGLVLACLGLDALTSDPFEMIKDLVMTNAGYTWVKKQIDEQGPDFKTVTSGAKDFTTWVQAAKGVEWILEKIKDLAKFIMDYKKKKEKLEEVDFYQIHADWVKLMATPSKYTRESTDRLVSSLLDMEEVVVKDTTIPPRLASALLHDIKEAKNMRVRSQKRAHEPIGVLIHGDPGQGKSLASVIVARAVSDIMQVGEPYSLPPDPKHFDDYKGQSVVIIDDLGQNPDGEDCALLCQMISCADFVPPMAALEEKGIKFTSDIIIATTNLKDLDPPTIKTPSALDRRFLYDMDIRLNPAFVRNGKLNVEMALHPCSHPGQHTKRCTPFMCGMAAKFYCRKNKREYTINELITALLQEVDRRKNHSRALDAIFQGRKSMLVEAGKEIPEGVIETLNVFKNNDVVYESIIAQLEDEGYMIPAKVMERQLERDNNNWKKWLAVTVGGLGVLAIIAGLVCAFIPMFNKKGEGAYATGIIKPKLVEPARRVNTQGPSCPDIQFAKSILNSNLMHVQDDEGNDINLFFVGGNEALVPKHLLRDKYYKDNQEIIVEDCVEYVSKSNVTTEVVRIFVSGVRPFRNIKKFIKGMDRDITDAYLLLQYPCQMIVPIPKVNRYGTILLSGRMVTDAVQYKYPTKPGWCGGVIVKAGHIVSMHIGGDGTFGYGARLKPVMVSEEGKINKVEESPITMNLSCRTKLEPSVYHDIFEGDKEPAVLHKNDPRLDKDLEFETVLFSKYDSPPLDIPVCEELNIAVEHYSNQLKSVLSPNVTEKITIEDAIRGIPGLDALDLDTSAGYPYCGMGIKKRDLIKEDDISGLLKGLTDYGTELPFVTFLKDELRPLEKIQKGKTRIVEASSVNDSVNMRTVFGKLFSEFHQTPGVETGSAVGCDPDVHWSQFANEFVGLKICAFDYSNYDGSIDAIWFNALKQVLVNLGYSTTDVSLIDYLCKSKHVYKNKLLHINGGMPSGCSGTSIFNSMINNLIIRTLVLMAYKNIDLDELKIIAYGDDVIVGYPFELQAADIAAMGKHFGLKMTPPDKGTEFKQDLNIEDVTFLKRGFQRDEKKWWLWHPLMDKQACYDSLRWTRNPHETASHVTSICYLYWHHGREEYNKFITKLNKVPITRAFNLPSYEFLERRWYDLFD